MSFRSRSMGERFSSGCFNKPFCMPETLAPLNHLAPSDPFPPLSPAEAQQRSQRMVDEITCHCDILGRLMQQYSGGETVARRQGESTRVRARREGG